MKRARNGETLVAALLAAVALAIGAAPEQPEVPAVGAIESAAARKFVRLQPFERPAEALDLAVRRSVFRRRQLLTGELVPSRATPVVVPRTRAWSVQIRWLIADGSRVEVGDRLIEFDSSSLVPRLEDQRIAAVEAAEALAQSRLDGAASTAEISLALEEARIVREKALLRATVPESLLSAREYQERQLALRRAEVELDKARQNLAAQRTGLAADLEMKSIALDNARREIEELERDLAALAPDAPAAGIALVESHPWESRKFVVGDTVWPGMTILTLPDLASLAVEAQLVDVDDGKIAVGMPAICRLDAYPERPYVCRVDRVSPVARAPSNESLRRSFRVELTLARTDPESIRPGMSVRVEVESARLDEALLVPRSTLVTGDGAPRALLAGGGAAAIELGACNAFECVVRGGLEEGRRLRAVSEEES